MRRNVTFHPISAGFQLNGARSALRQTAFTLIELLVVIAIIAILAALLIPAVLKAKTSGQKIQAKMDIKQLATAIKAYESTYNQFPISTKASDAALSAQPNGPEDFTFGGKIKNTTVATPGVTYSPTNYNAEIIAILLNWTNFPNRSTAWMNVNHVKNPKGEVFFSPKMVSGQSPGGVGEDGVFRDPWGTPYIVTIDVNGDGKTRDAFYRLPQVSGTTPGSNIGLDGFIFGPNGFECGSSVTVWSAGVDRDISVLARSDQGVNKDNIVSWK